MTVREKLNSMDDNEFAEWLIGFVYLLTKPKKYITPDGDMSGIEGYLNLRDSKKTMTFMASVDDNGKWEHVSVSYNGETKKLPTWTEMCAVKDLFWEPEEEVHQIHPKASQYVHGYGRKENILHLWRPAGGWSEEE